MFYLAFSMMRNTVSPLEQATDIANKLAAGDLRINFRLTAVMNLVNY